MALSHLLYSACIVLLCYVIRKAVAPWLSPLRVVPGPPNASLLYGNFRDIWRAEFNSLYERWTLEYGLTYRYKGFLSRNHLYTLDPRAINHVLTHSTEFPKPATVRNILARIVGEGLLIAEGDAHRKQRRVMNPAFGPAQIRELTPIFVDKSTQLRDALQGQLDPDGAPVRLDILAWLSRATLDIIGLAGFGYAFGALDAKETELNNAFAAMFSATEHVPLLPMLQAMIPLLRLIPSERDRTIRWAQATMDRIGLKLIEERRAAIRAENAGRHVEKGDVLGRDLLSLLVRANMAVDIPDSQRLSDKDMLAQIPTFLAAGHETTSTGTTWALFALTQNVAAQRRLREELLACPYDAPTMDELQGLPYLDAVVRETLRLHAPVSNSLRMAEHDCTIPLAEPFLDRKGMCRTEIPMAKGDAVVIPILGLHRLTRIWGPDAGEFVPERWLKKPLPESVHNMPGVWGNMLTFLSGPRACIGYRFSLIEMKALLFMLVRAFEFELAVPVTDIQKKQAIVTRPLVASEMDKGNQMPLLVRAYRPPQDA